LLITADLKCRLLAMNKKTSPTRRQSGARDFETADHIDKQKYIFHLRYMR